MSYTPFTQKVIEVIHQIPRGKVATYGQIARLAGSPKAARQVVRILHTCSEKNRLPWHRIINKKGEIALKPFQGYEIQKQFLEQEGIQLNPDGKIDLLEYLWRPETN